MFDRVRGMIGGDRKEARALQAELEELRPFIGIARDLSAAAAKFAEYIRTDDALLRDRLQDEIARQTAQQQQERIREVFDALPANQRASLLMQLYQDNTLRVALEAQRAAVNAKTLAQLAKLATATGGVDLTLLPYQSVVSIWLYDEQSYDRSDLDDLDDSSSQRRFIKAANLGGGRFHVLEDERHSSVGARKFMPYIDYHQVVDLGCMLNRGKPDERLEPMLYRGTPMDSSIPTDGRFSSYDSAHNTYDCFVVGFLAVNNVDILS